MSDVMVRTRVESRRQPRRAIRLPWMRGLLSLIGVALGLALWQLAARVLVGDTRLLAAPTDVVAELRAHTDYYVRNGTVTLGRSVRSLLIGTLAATLVALVVTLSAPLRNISERVGTMLFSIPVVALAPVVRVMFPDSSTVALGSFFSFFGMFLALLVGLGSVEASVLDSIRSLGGGRLTILRKARIPAAIPSFFTGLKVSVPAAVLAVVLVEALGDESGLGVGIIGALSGLDSARAWSIGVVAALLSGGGYLAALVLERVIGPRFGQTHEGDR